MSDDKPASEKAASHKSTEYNPKSPVDMARKAMKEKTAAVCCCCVLQCSDKVTEGYTCCCCFPIKCGVELIAASVVLITLVQFLEIFYQTLND